MAPTRRQVLAGTGGAVGTIGVSGAAASRITAEEMDTWEPPAGTWPCGQYGPGETAANPHAPVPSDPDVHWRTEVPAVRRAGGFVVGPDRVYVSGDRLTALHRGDGTVQWTRREAHGPLVVRDGTLYHTTAHAGTQDPRLSAFDARTGEPRWRTTLPDRSNDLTVTADHLVVNGVAYDIADGRPAWSVDDGDSVASDGVLYSQPLADRLTKYGDRSVLDETLDRGPSPVWQRDYEGSRSYTVVGDGRIVRGNVGSVDSTAALACLDAETGRRTWSALTPAEFDAETDGAYGDPDDYGLTTRVMAVTGGRCFVAAKTHSFGDAEDARREGSALVALSLLDGSVDWSRSISSAENSVSDIVVADGTVIVAADGHSRRQGRGDSGPVDGGILGLDDGTGETKWRVPTEVEPGQVAIADDTVFVVTEERADDPTNLVLAVR